MVFVIMRARSEDRAEIERFQDAGWQLYAEKPPRGMLIRGVAVGQVSRAKGGQCTRARCVRVEEETRHRGRRSRNARSIPPPPVSKAMEKMMNMQKNAEGHALNRRDDSTDRRRSDARLQNRGRGALRSVRAVPAGTLSPST
jgi:hypothetical protein